MEALRTLLQTVSFSTRCADSPGAPTGGESLVSHQSSNVPGVTRVAALLSMHCDISGQSVQSNMQVPSNSVIQLQHRDQYNETSKTI